MAKPRKYTEQFAFVGTRVHYDLIVAVAKAAGVDKAPIVREALDGLFGTVDGELAGGDTFEQAVARVVEKMQATAPAA